MNYLSSVINARKTNRTMRFTSAGMLLLAVGLAFLLAQNKDTGAVPSAYSTWQSGAQMYRDYCAACHGPEGKGNGPAGQFLKVPPPDLSKLAQRNKGKYPARTVARALGYGTRNQAGGSEGMPHWGPLFKSQNPNEADFKIASLTKYVESLQQK